MSTHAADLFGYRLVVYDHSINTINNNSWNIDLHNKGYFKSIFLVSVTISVQIILLSFRALVALQKQAPLLLMPVLGRPGNKPVSQWWAEPAEKNH